LRRLLDRLIIRAHRIKCAMYVGDCGLCREWKQQKGMRR
jgi:hypothetical protein